MSFPDVRALVAGKIQMRLFMVGPLMIGHGWQLGVSAATGYITGRAANRSDTHF